MTFLRPLVSVLSKTASIASITTGSGTPSSYHFFINAQSFALRMNGVPRRRAKCASISWHYVSAEVSAVTAETYHALWRLLGRWLLGCYVAGLLVRQNAKPQSAATRPRD